MTATLASPLALEPLTCLAAAAAYLLLCIQILAQIARQSRPADRATRALLLACALSSLWALSLAPVWAHRGWWSHGLDILRYGAWFALLHVLLGSDSGRPLRRLPALAVLLCLFAVVGGYTAMIVLAVLGLVLLEQLFRNLPEDGRSLAKPLCLSLAGVFLFDGYLWSEAALFGAPDRSALIARPIVHAFAAGLLLVGGSRHHHWIVRLRLSRSLAFYSASLFIAGGYLLLIAVAGYYVRYFGGGWGRVLYLALAFMALLCLAAFLLSRRLRATLKVLLAKHLLDYRYDYREEWQKFTLALSSDIRPGELSQSVIRGLAGMVESPAGALWLLGSDRSDYRQLARWNLPAIDAREPAASPWIVFMRERGWVLNLDEYRSHPGRYEHHCVPGWLAELPKAWLMVPLFLGDAMTGFVVLVRPIAPVQVDWEVLDLLKTAARQAASFIAQAQATEALLEARKFDAFNRMSAFVVHDLKNIVTQLSLMARNARRLGANPEFQADMLLTVENSLDRMRQLMAQLREGAPATGGSSGVDLALIAADWAREAQARGRRVELDLAPGVYARGQTERLRRIVGHLVHNALDATEPHGGRVWIRSQRSGSQASLLIGDEGTGMSAEFIRERLFRPFESTKPAGMGIGAYESLQYVQELGGRMEVDSREGQGTRVTLLLPAMDAVTTSDLS